MPGPRRPARVRRRLGPQAAGVRAVDRRLEPVELVAAALRSGRRRRSARPRSRRPGRSPPRRPARGCGPAPGAAGRDHHHDGDLVGDGAPRPAAPRRAASRRPSADEHLQRGLEAVLGGRLVLDLVADDDLRRSRRPARRPTAEVVGRGRRWGPGPTSPAAVSIQVSGPSSARATASAWFRCSGQACTSSPTTVSPLEIPSSARGDRGREHRQQRPPRRSRRSGDRRTGRSSGSRARTTPGAGRTVLFIGARAAGLNRSHPIGRLRPVGPLTCASCGRRATRRRPARRPPAGGAIRCPRCCRRRTASAGGGAQRLAARRPAGPE